MCCARTTHTLETGGTNMDFLSTHKIDFDNKNLNNPKTI